MGNDSISEEQKVRRDYLIKRIKDKVRKLILTLDYFLWLLLDPSKFKRIRREKIKKVLIIHTGAIGELLASTPAIETLKKELGAKVDYLARKGSSDIIKNNPFVDNIIDYEESFKDNLNKIKKSNYDLAVILWPGSLKMTMLCMMAGIRYRIGCFKMVREGPAFFFTRRVLPTKFEGKHAVESNVMMLSTIGLKNDNPSLKLEVDKKSEKKIADFLKKNSIKRFAVIHPGYGKFKEGKHISRRWPEERYAKVADWLSENYKLKILFTGTKDERVLAEEIYSFSRRKKNLMITSGEFSLNESIALLSRAEILIAPDTSMIHVSAALDTKVVDLMSRSPPWEWRPWMDKDRNRVLYYPKDKFGNSCGDEDRSCILKISEDEVKKAIQELLFIRR